MDEEQLIKKWLKDQLTVEELEAFRNTSDYQSSLEVIRYATKFKAPDFSPSDHMEDLSTRKLRGTRKTMRLWPVMALRIAAALLVGFIIYYFYPANSLVNISTAASEKVTIELPDASVVTVNVGSELSYSQNTWQFHKHINLNGEAYFDVVDGGKFQVSTTEGIVTVLGTKFNVKQRQQNFEVSCYEGTVKVTSGKYEQVLQAGDVLRKEDGQLKRSTNILQAPQWTSNISAFQNAPLSEVLAEIERQYGINVTAVGIDSGRMFTGGFVHQDLESALDAITAPLNLHYSLDSTRQVTITAK